MELQQVERVGGLGVETFYSKLRIQGKMKSCLGSQQLPFDLRK